MNHAFLLIGAVWASLLGTTCHVRAADGDSLATAIASVPDYRGVRLPSLEARYPETRCLKILERRTARQVGLVCRTRSPEFVADIGITPQAGALDHSPQPARRQAYVVATPMSLYPLQPLSGIDGVLSAIVDCDTASGAIYRATASCHVAVSDPGADEVTYSNFVWQGHMDGSGGVSEAQVVPLWRALQRRPR